MPESSPTAQFTTDQLGLGRTQGQRGAEILAGLRAELMPSQEANALCRFSGRIAARIVLGIVSDKRLLNFVPVRLGGMTVLAKHYLPPEKENPLIVDIAAGFAPRGVLMAQANPNMRVIEIDLPDVIRDKQRRLKKAMDIPPNIEWRSADLGVTPLSEVLDDQKADVIIAEGLVAYFDLPEFSQIAERIKASLVEGGVFICDIPWKPGMKEIEEAGRWFSRFAGTFKGVAKDEDETRQTMANASYGEVIIHHPVDVATEHNLPTPVFEPSLFVVGRN